MPDPRSQADLYQDYIVRQEAGTEVTDNVPLPELDRFFRKPGMYDEIIENEVRIPGLRDSMFKSKEDTAKLLASILDSHEGVCGFKWELGEDVLDLYYVESHFEQRGHEDEVFNQEFQSLLVMLLKSRKNMKGIKWEFGEPTVEISYIA